MYPPKSELEPSYRGFCPASQMFRLLFELYKIQSRVEYSEKQYTFLSTGKLKDVKHCVQRNLSKKLVIKCIIFITKNTI